MIVSAALCPSPPLLARDLTGKADILPELRDACAAAVTRLLEARPDVVVVVGAADETATWPAAARLDLPAYAPALASTADNSKKRGALPLPLGIGALLLDEAGYAGPRLLQAVAASAAPDECARLARTLAGPAAFEREGPAAFERGKAAAFEPGGPAALERGGPAAPECDAPATVPGIRGPAGGTRRIALLIVGDGTACRSLSAPGYLDERAEPFDAEVERALRDGDLAALAALDPALAADLMATNRAPLQVLAAALAESVAPAKAQAASRAESAAPRETAAGTRAAGTPAAAGPPAVGPPIAVGIPAVGPPTAVGIPAAGTPAVAIPAANGSSSRRPRADILYSAAPFGVAYLAATVTPPGIPDLSGSVRISVMVTTPGRRARLPAQDHREQKFDLCRLIAPQGSKFSMK